jgi:hypothetical protein
MLARRIFNYFYCWDTLSLPPPSLGGRLKSEREKKKLVSLDVTKKVWITNAVFSIYERNHLKLTFYDLSM